MTESNRHDALRSDPADVPSPSSAGLDGSDPLVADAPGELAPSEAFQLLANDVRVEVLLHLYRAERGDAGPRSFATIQDLVGSDSSARFAYHLRQLDGHFVRKTPEGYVLTSAGSRAAEAILRGTFTRTESRQAS